MILLDTNVLIYASTLDAPLHFWARRFIARHEDVVANAVSVAEYCVGDTAPEFVLARLRAWGVDIADVPAAAAEICADAYRLYCSRRIAANPENPAPKTPLPDFFIGAHASVMGWDIATADESRFRTYFPEVTLHTPPDSPE